MELPPCDPWMEQSYAMFAPSTSNLVPMDKDAVENKMGSP